MLLSIFSQVVVNNRKRMNLLPKVNENAMLMVQNLEIIKKLPKVNIDIL